MSDGSLFSLSGLDLPQEAAATTPQPSDSPEAGNGPSQSLYRKYRPQSFDEDDLFGQEHVVNTLRNAIALGRLAHAYLFCGPRGTGKTTTARLLAKAVNCLDPDPYKRPCNVCAACVAINKGATTDVIEIDAASNRGIDDIRDLRERVKYAPTQLRTKFYIIDEAHQITGAAANAFLKTLEEPPAHTRFVLATTDPEELLQTIVSRCQRFDFRRINLDAMQANLRKVARLEQISITDDAILAIARHATGSLRDAQGLLDQVAVYRDGTDANTTVTADLVRTVLGVSRNDRVESIATALADRDPAAGLASISAAIDAGEDMRQLGRQLLAYLRLLLIQRAGGATDLDESAKLLAERFQIQELADLVRGFAEIDNKVKHATLAQLPLELAIVEGALRGQGTAHAGQIPALSSPAFEEGRGQSSPGRRDMSRNSGPDFPYPEQERNPFDDVPPPFDDEPQPRAERPNRPSLRDRVRGAGANPPASAAPPAPRDEARPSRHRPERAATQARSSIGEQPARYGAAPRNDAPAARPPQNSAEPAAAPQATPASPASSDQGPAVGIETIVDLWTDIRNDVKAVNRRTEALLQQVDPAGVVGNQVVLVAPYEFHRNKVNSDEARSIIEDVISRRLSRRVSILCVDREEAQAMISRRSSAPASPAPVAAQSARTEAVAPGTTPPAVASASEHRPEATSVAPSEPAPDPGEVAASPYDPVLEEARLKAVRNIFDAEDVDGDTEYV